MVYRVQSHLLANCSTLRTVDIGDIPGSLVRRDTHCTGGTAAARPHPAAAGSATCPACCCCYWFSGDATSPAAASVWSTSPDARDVDARSTAALAPAPAASVETFDSGKTHLSLWTLAAGSFSMFLPIDNLGSFSLWGEHLQNVERLHHDGYRTLARRGAHSPSCALLFMLAAATLTAMSSPASAVSRVAKSAGSGSPVLPRSSGIAAMQAGSCAHSGAVFSMSLLRHTRCDAKLMVQVHVHLQNITHSCAHKSLLRSCMSTHPLANIFTRDRGCWPCSERTARQTKNTGSIPVKDI